MPIKLSEVSQKATDALFDALAVELLERPCYTCIHLKGAANFLRATYNEPLILDLAQKISKVEEYYLQDGIEQQVEVAREQILLRAQAGNTLICNGLHHVHPCSANFASKLQQVLGLKGKPGARIFYTNATQQAYSLHLDPYFTLTFQIQGSKLWKISRRCEKLDYDQLNHSILAPQPGSIVDYPCGHVIGPDLVETEFEDVLLEMGDAMLIHPCVWHQVLPVNLSYSVAIDLMPPTQTDSQFEIAIVRHV